jgi:protein SCO1/2
MRALAAAVVLSLCATAAPAAKRNVDYFPDIELITQDGKPVRFRDLIRGRQVAINAIFTTCKDVCPLETANMVQLKKVLGKRAGTQVHLYSISIDPKRDTPEVLKSYAEKFGADWTFLTGRPEEIRLLMKKLALIRDRDDPTARVGHHSAYLMVGAEHEGQWTRFSAVDNPRFLAARMGAFLGWRDMEPGASYAEAKPITVPNGQRLFVSKCSACHTVGKGDKLGPDLAGVTDRRERAWLVRYIQEPDEVLASGDPIASALHSKYKKIGMPNLRLGSSDVHDLVEFLQSAPVRARAPHKH